jgi:hypothetical protein
VYQKDYSEKKEMITPAKKRVVNTLMEMGEREKEKQMMHKVFCYKEKPRRRRS